MSPPDAIPEPSIAAVRLYRRLVTACLLGGICSQHGWGRFVREHVLPVLQHPKFHHHAASLEHAFQRLAEPGEDGQSEPARASVLYTTILSTVGAAATILRAEADLLEQHLICYRQNRDLARGFLPRGLRIVRNRLAAAQQPIHAAACEAMRQTANLTGADSTALFDEGAVKRAIQEVGESLVADLSQQLRDELVSVREEILRRSYVDQDYDRDGQVTRRSCLPAVERDLSAMGLELRLPPVEPKWLVPVEPVEVVPKVRDWLARKTGWFDERTEAEKQRDKRQTLLDQHLNGLRKVAEEYQQAFSQAAEASIRAASQRLCEEVERCWRQGFESEQAAQASVVRWRGQAATLQVPPLLLYTATGALRG